MTQSDELLIENKASVYTSSTECVISNAEDINRMSIYSVSGSCIKTKYNLRNEHVITFDIQDVTKGVYFLLLDDISYRIVIR